MDSSDNDTSSGISTVVDIRKDIMIHKNELDRIGRWVGPKLELIRPHILALVRTGIPIPGLKAILEEAGIKTSVNHLRKHIKAMFPAEYRTLYARNVSAVSVDVVHDTPPANEIRKKQSAKIQVEELLADVRAYRGTGK